MRRLAFAVAVLLSGCPSPAEVETACPIPGEVVHWMADYCMATIGTDDEIAASDCIAKERTTPFADDCAAKTHFKRGMCALSVARQVTRTSVDECVADPGFVGATVRNGGVGS